MTSTYLNEKETKIQFHHRMDIEGEYIPSIGSLIVNRERIFKVYSVVYNYDTGIISINAEITDSEEKYK
jgi:hypothetical protein